MNTLVENTDDPMKNIFSSFHSLRHKLYGKLAVDVSFKKGFGSCYLIIIKAYNMYKNSPYCSVSAIKNKRMMLKFYHFCMDKKLDIRFEGEDFKDFFYQCLRTEKLEKITKKK